MAKTLNEELNKLPAYIYRSCVLCKRKYPQTILNIEGFIHHGSDFICLDINSCKKAKNK